MDFLSRLQRELPNTDKDRYDIAYEQGASQARSGLLFGGVLIGALAGAAAMYLLDPTRGAGRRAQLTSRATGLRNDIARTARRGAQDVENRVDAAAPEQEATKSNRRASNRAKGSQDETASELGAATTAG
jgi:gas vesicle protein